MRRRALIFGTAATSILGFALWWTRRWHYIVIHHSAGANGDLELLKRVHRARQPGDPIDAIPYHFVIGNGRGMAMGEVAETKRWQSGIRGAHVNGSKRNLFGIGICLIGNFENSKVPEPQYKALIELVRKLRLDHGIAARNVSLHGETPGQSSLCPGRNFPGARFRKDIA